jgi:hypothetical protein
VTQTTKAARWGRVRQMPVRARGLAGERPGGAGQSSVARRRHRRLGCRVGQAGATRFCRREFGSRRADCFHGGGQPLGDVGNGAGEWPLGMVTVTDPRPALRAGPACSCGATARVSPDGANPKSQAKSQQAPIPGYVQPRSVSIAAAKEHAQPRPAPSRRTRLTRECDCCSGARGEQATGDYGR